jgi:DMSO reductase family type II enzyme chaperone
MFEIEKSIALATDNTADGRALIAQVRGEIYKLLAVCFYEPNEALARDVVDGSLALALKNLLQKIEVPGWEESVTPLVGQPDGLDDVGMTLSLKRDYTRLFIGPGHLPAPPYESVHRHDVPELERGLVMGRSTTDARRQYAAAGLQLSPQFTDLPDHIAVELEFMCFLCAKEAEAWQTEDEEAAIRRQSAQHAFLSGHLGQWVPAFCGAVVEAAQTDFYRGLAQLARAYIEAECHQVNVVARPLDGGVAVSRSPAHAKGGQE